MKAAKLRDILLKIVHLNGNSGGKGVIIKVLTRQHKSKKTDGKNERMCILSVYHNAENIEKQR